MTIKRIIVIGLWVLFILVVTFLAMNTSTGHWDFITYHYNAERLIAGEALYGSYTQRFDYIYPPLLAQGIAPLTTLFSLTTLSFGWHILSLVCLVLSVTLVNHHVENPTQRIVFWLIPVLFIPNYQSLWVGQISLVLLLCFTGAWYAYKHDHPLIVGVLLAFSTWLKVYPIFLIIYFMWRRDWKVTISTFLVGMLLLVVQVAVADISTITTYFFDVLPGLASEGQMTGLFKNSSILGFTFKLFTGNADIIPIVDSLTLASLSRWVITGLVVGTSLVMISRPQKTQKYIVDDTRFDLEYGLVILVSLLFASTLWVSGMSPLILCYLLLLKADLTQTVRRWVWVSFGVVSFYFLYLLAFQPGNQLSALVLSMGFYGVFLLWILYMVQLRQVTKLELGTE